MGMERKSTHTIEEIKELTSELLFTSKKGLVEGISNLFIEQLNLLPLFKRPIWCVDKKRKKLLIKEDVWSEDTNQEKTKDAIKSLGVKQTKNINKYTQENPDWMQDDKKKDMFISIVGQVTKEISDDKQVNVLNNLLDNVHLNDEAKKILQNS